MEIESIDDGKYIYFEDGTIWFKRLKKWTGLCKSNGYLQLGMDGKAQGVHRVIYEKFNGEIPDGLYVDHINNVRNDNRLENLQLLTHKQNCQKQSINSKNTSGFTGIHFRKDMNYWRVRIENNGKYIFNKSGFKTAEEANDARNKFLDENPELCKYYTRNN